MSQNVFNPAVLVLYLWPTVSWVALFSLIWNMRSWNAAVFTPERYRVLLCDFYPGLIQPRAALQRHSTLPREAFGGFVFFFFLQRSSVHCSFLSSVISCVEGGISCLFWPRWRLAPEQNELLWVGESQTSPSWVHPNCLSPNPGLHLSCCISLHLHLQLFIPSLYLPRPLLAPWLTAAPVQLNPRRWPHSYDLPCLSFILRI